MDERPQVVQQQGDRGATWSLGGDKHCGAGLKACCQTVVTLVLLVYLALQRQGKLRFGAAAPYGSRPQNRAMSLLQHLLQVHPGAAEHPGCLHATSSLSA